MRLGGKLVKLRITIRIIRTPGRAGTPLRGAHVLNVMSLSLVRVVFERSILLHHASRPIFIRVTERANRRVS